MSALQQHRKRSDRLSSQRQRWIWTLSLLLLTACNVLLTACGTDREPEAALTNLRFSQADSITVPPQDHIFQDVSAEARRKLTQFNGVLQLMRPEHFDSTPYQPFYDADARALQAANTIDAMQKVIQQLDTHMAPDQIAMAQPLAQYMVAQFHQDVSDWGNNHQYSNQYDHKNYPLGFEYAVQPNDYGEGSKLDDKLNAATTLSDYQSLILQINDDIATFKCMRDNLQDRTPWNRAHDTDQRLLQYFHTSQGTVIVTSLAEQALRLYQDGKLVHAFQIVTGQYYRPTIVGKYQINAHTELSTFLSFEKPGSPFYFPPTEIPYAMNFGDPTLGYFIHTSKWRTLYGTGMQFPHFDPHHDNSESRNGSHGCINLPLDEDQWLYQQVADGSAIIIY
jgi:Uncharacterized protein conserved in bacteria